MLRLFPKAEAVAAREVCQVFVGYYVENKHGIVADEILLPTSSHYFVGNLRLSAYKQKSDNA